MTSTLLTEFSAAFQIAVAVAAIWQIRRSGKRLAWGLIATGFLVLASERVWTLIMNQWMMPPQAPCPHQMVREQLMLAVSALLFAGVWLIGGLFRKAQENEEEAVRTSKRIQDILDRLPIGVFTFDQNMIVTSCNPLLAKIIGVPSARLLGLDLSTLPNGRLVSLLRDTLAGNGREATDVYRSALSGRNLFGMIVTLPELDQSGAVTGGLGFVVDLTKVRMAEEEARRLASLVERSPEAICVTDADGKITYVNRAACELTGSTREELLQNTLKELLSDHTGPATYEEMWNRLQSGGTWRGTFAHRRKDGTIYEVDSLITPIGGSPNGDITGFVAFDRDITEQRQLEERVRQIEKMETVGQLAGGIAHDFNNALTAILSTVELLQSTGDRVGLEDSLKVIHDAGEHAAQLTRRLLAFSRRQLIQPVDLDLNQAISRDLPMIRRLIGENISIELIEGDRLATVHADPGQLSQVLMNLCANARDAMPNGGTITIETKNMAINGEFVAAHPWATPGQYVLLTVADTGRGMDEATLKKIFEPFFTTKTKGGGTGLGLASVYGIVTQHDGLIHAYSEPGLGTSFKIYLPAVDRRAIEVSAMIEGPVVGGNEAILLVEDDRDVREALAATLGAMGYTVTPAEDGAAALRALESLAGGVDLVISDLVMPVMGGIELATEVARRDPGLRFLLLSGYAEDLIFDEASRGMRLEFLQKPFGLDTLLRTIRKILDSPTP